MIGLKSLARGLRAVAERIDPFEGYSHGQQAARLVGHVPRKTVFEQNDRAACEQRQEAAIALLDDRVVGYVVLLMVRRDVKPMETQTGDMDLHMRIPDDARAAFGIVINELDQSMIEHRLEIPAMGIS